MSGERKLELERSIFTMNGVTAITHNSARHRCSRGNRIFWVALVLQVLCLKIEFAVFDPVGWVVVRNRVMNSAP